ncbi:hypothetical protein AB1Y20_010432 [Prymnesium parvum]|uniref:t-SNARE coiled-coil homology domain-containing protein n=1 Tax=Prymnesium parvum TaxID=97485 RepID=A0AB34IRG2_PRYPA|mmetsp:Transcript_14544/g.34635  ORF Transcript_14544/g.34635 Transcript_14544/m.34635 type:complete len:249 (-) Transcript_14544:169-915(-)
MEDLVRTIGIISRNNNALASLLAQMSADSSSEVEPRELRVLLQDTSQLARETGERLMQLQKAEGQPARQRTMLSKLNKDFQFVLRRFQQLTQQVSQHARRRPAERCHSSGSFGEPGGDPEYDEQHGLLEAERVQHEAQLKMQREAAAHATLHTVEERERMIKQVETTVGEVNEIFVDLAGLVSEQSSSIDHISTAIERTAAQTSFAADELRSAHRSKQRSRSRTCCLYLSVVLAGALLLLIFNAQLRT